MSEKGHQKCLSVDHYPLFIADMHSEPDFVLSGNVDTVEPFYKVQEKLTIIKDCY